MEVKYSTIKRMLGRAFLVGGLYLAQPHDVYAWAGLTLMLLAGVIIGSGEEI